MSTSRHIYLCSQSSRRRELLKQIGVRFEALLLRRGTGVDETPQPDEDPEHYVRRICESKARAGWENVIMRNLPGYPVLAADTTVTLDGRLLGKPADRADAIRMLRLLSGRTHQVFTAVAMICGSHFELLFSASSVTFVPLSDERIHRYVLSNEPYDKAGGYGIQGRAGSFVARLEGSYTGVMGLPLCETVELLHNFDYPVP
jgi:septum formation protein